MKQITIEAIIDNIPAVTEFVDGELKSMVCPMKTHMQIHIAVDEIFSNISRYAYGSEAGSVTVIFDVDENPQVVKLTFIDNGVQYNPLENPDPDITLSADERPIGGLGIFMVKKTMDEVVYDYKNGQNILTIKKNL